MRRRTRATLKRLGSALLVLLILLGGFALYTIYLSGAFKQIAPHFAGACHRIVGIVGIEDITIAPDGKHAFLSADDRRAALAGRQVPGGIWLYDLGSEALPVNMTPLATAEFHPHGISLWPLPDGRGRLFVVNHPDEGRLPPGEGRQTIELFDWRAEGLVYRATLADPLIVSPNGIVAVGVDTFYATNDHHWHGFFRTIEDWLRIPLADVIYFDGAKFRVVADGIRFANGVNVAANGQHLYVASTTGRALLVFDRDAATAALSNRTDIALGTAPDNIERGADGALWIGAHPKLLKYLAHVKKAKNLSPSEVLKVSPKADGGFTVAQVYLDDGREISGSATGAVSGKRLLIGPVFDDHFLDCTMR